VRTPLVTTVLLCSLLGTGCDLGGGRSHQESDPHRQQQLATSAARHWLDHNHSADVAVATFEAYRGTVTQPNTGNTCESRILLSVKLYGGFAGIDTGGRPGAGDSDVTLVGLTVDGRTGKTCLIGVGTGEQKPDPDATRLNLSGS